MEIDIVSEDWCFHTEERSYLLFNFTVKWSAKQDYAWKSSESS